MLTTASFPRPEAMLMCMDAMRAWWIGPSAM